MKNIVKILTALATIAGAIYIIATYGEQIVAWAQKIWNAMPKKAALNLEVDLTDEDNAEEDTAPEAEAAEEAAAEEVPVEEAVEEPAPEIVVAENEPVAAEEDFAE